MRLGQVRSGRRHATLSHAKPCTTHLTTSKSTATPHKTSSYKLLSFETSAHPVPEGTGNFPLEISLLDKVCKGLASESPFPQLVQATPSSLSHSFRFLSQEPKAAEGQIHKLLQVCQNVWAYTRVDTYIHISISARNIWS